MQENIKEWYRPDDLDEVVDIMHNGSGLPYAGGTGLKSSQVSGLIDLRQLNLNYIRETQAGITIGSMTRFNDIACYHWPDSRRILARAVGQAASNPLRNLITLGGSLAFRPIWSNVPTPLLALDASVRVVGRPSTAYPVTDFLQQKRGSEYFITEVVLPPAPGFGAYFRFARTRFDYAALDLAVYLETKSGQITLCRIAVGNALPVARRITAIENQIAGRQLDDPENDEIISAVVIKPARNPNFGREFLLNLLKTELRRAFENIREQAHASKTDN
jgi:CO/xanthine dehydrogenase FAD-binding subunit